MIIGISLSSGVNSGTGTCPNSKLYNLEYVEDVVLRSDDPTGLQDFPDHLNDSTGKFGTWFIPSECEMPLHD